MVLSFVVDGPIDMSSVGGIDIGYAIEVIP